MIVVLYCRGSGDYPELVDLQAEVSKLKLDLEKVIISTTNVIITRWMPKHREVSLLFICINIFVNMAYQYLSTHLGRHSVAILCRDSFHNKAYLLLFHSPSVVWLDFLLAGT